jgi:hypothetical protein
MYPAVLVRRSKPFHEKSLGLVTIEVYETVYQDEKLYKIVGVLGGGQSVDLGSSDCREVAFEKATKIIVAGRFPRNRVSYA